MQTEPQKTVTFTDRMRVRMKGILDPIGAFLNGIGLTPDGMTILGVLGTLVGAIFLARGDIFLGGLLILIFSAFDALDGTMARLRGQVTSFGAFLDSVTDRYSELFVLGGLLIYFTSKGDTLTVIGIYLAAAGSVLVSYVKARAELLKFTANVGLLTRVERYVVTVVFLLLNLPIPAIWIIAVFANITALQRIWTVRQQATRTVQNQ